MKRFLFLTFGFEKPTPEVMSAWQEWFASIAGRMVDQGGLHSGGRAFTEDGSEALPFGADSLTGYVIFNAETVEEAEAIAGNCPIVASNQVYEITAK